MIIDIVRHGQSKGNISRVLQGQMESPLSELGVEQSTKLGKFLDPDYDSIYSSPLLRAVDTAIIAMKLPDDKSINLKEGLKEMNFGSMQGVSFNDFTIEQTNTWNKVLTDPHFKNHGGENRIEFYDRIRRTLHEITSEAEHRGDRKLIIFTHGGFIRTFFYYGLNIETKIVPNTQILRFIFEDGNWEFIANVNNLLST